MVENRRITLSGREPRHDVTIILEGAGRRVEDLQAIERNQEAA